jgi:hypothetical protein
MGRVYSGPDPLLGRRYYFGNPDLAKRKLPGLRKARARVLPSKVIIVTE